MMLDKKNLNKETQAILAMPVIQQYISSGLLTVDHVLKGIDQHVLETLKLDIVQRYIDMGHLTMQLVLKGLSDDAKIALVMPVVQGYLASGHLSMTRVLEGINYETRDALAMPVVQQLIANNQLTVERVLEGISHDAQLALEMPIVQQYIADGRITLERVLAGISHNAREALKINTVQYFIDNDQLAIKRVLEEMDFNTCQALRDLNTQQMLRDGRLTINQVFNREYMGQRPHINNNQSTHNAEVHASSSESASKLMGRYASRIEGYKLDQVLTGLKSSIAQQRLDKIDVAKRCIDRLLAPEYTHLDPQSDVSTRQLIALCWLAIHDDTCRPKGSTIANMMAMFITGLYEIQRGYNLNKDGIDDDHPHDSYICAGGTFNKLLEKLSGMHPDVEIRYITQETATLKLKAVVSEEAIEYVKSRANPATEEEYQSFKDFMTQLEEDGIELIYEVIRETVAKRMFEEFGSLYIDKSDKRFTDMIDAGKYLDLPNLDELQSIVEQSEGCRKANERLDASVGA